ncbi:DedA family protein [Peribacillus saganii]|uniref:DedA family protein n=1 Tax=Peribacillus saganii TaxID=2303992 RepID=A0A372LSW5_9BACI|nr:DedA family protein [Peribacillus saganii]RFU70644.1 DedA family protein [Peribacillus saganii]
MKDLINEIFVILSDLGYFGIALGLMIEVIPSEIVLAYGGYLISLGKVSFIGALLAGIIGGTLAQMFLYWAGYYGGRPFLDKYGKYIFINSRHLDLAEEWFHRYGAGVIFSARFIPVARHAISIPAGIAKMPVFTFVAYTAAAMVPWTIFFLYLGTLLGSNWGTIKEKAAPFISFFILAAIACGIVYMLWKRKQAPPILSVPRKK